MLEGLTTGGREVGASTLQSWRFPLHLFNRIHVNFKHSTVSLVHLDWSNGGPLKKYIYCEHCNVVNMKSYMKKKHFPVLGNEPEPLR